jgi:nucleotide-binding universal stress UspA family protein
MSGVVVIGVSGSTHAHPAIEWGVDHARAHGLRVELVHVVDIGLVFSGSPYAAEAVVAAEEQVTELSDRISSQNPELGVSGHALIGSPNEKLVEHAATAELLVIGSHVTHLSGITDIYSRRPGRIAAAADCTVVVVPRTADGPSRSGVVVGIDGSELSQKALRFAADAASRLQEPLTAVYAWASPWPWGLEQGSRREVAGPDEELVVAESLAGIAEDFPDLTVQRQFPREYPVEALCELAAVARLLAIGSHGRNAIERFWLGSVSTDVLLRMPSPVAVVR